MAFARLKKAGLTQDTQNKQEEILNRANEILHLYRQDQLSIDPKYYPALAEYIDAFGSQHKEEMLNKLQSSVNFDVLTYLEEKSQPLWRRLFPKKTLPILSADTMTSEMKKYALLSNKMSHNRLAYYTNLTQKIEVLQQTSEEYMQAFLDGKLGVEPQDLDVFKTYIKTLNVSINEGSLAARSLEEIEKLQQNQSLAQPARSHSTHLRKPVITSLAFKRTHENFFTKATKRLSALWTDTKEKQSSIALPSFKKETFWNRAKVAAVTTLVVIGSALALKHGFSQQTSEISKADATSTVKKTQPEEKTTKTISAAEFANIQQSQDTSATKTEDKHAKIWQNYYDTTIDIVAPTVHVNKDELYAQIDGQVNKGILTLPEGVSKEKVALNYVLFKAYGLQSSLETALSADKKLSDKQQEDFARDAGIKQTDIKQIALKKHGKLSTYSAYNRSSKTQKTRYAKSLQEVRQIIR